MIAYVAFVGAILCAVMRCALGKYIFSACATLLCACAVLVDGADLPDGLMAAGLFMSVAGDWLLCHEKQGGNRFIYGVAGFFAAHCMFALSAAQRFEFNMPALVIALALLIGYLPYLFIRILPGICGALRYALISYMLVSILSLWCAMSMAGGAIVRALYIAGIGAILFSDTMIAESKFAGNAFAERLVLPTYYLCHVLITLSALIR